MRRSSRRVTFCFFIEEIGSFFLGGGGVLHTAECIYTIPIMSVGIVDSVGIHSTVVFPGWTPQCFCSFVDLFV